MNKQQLLKYTFVANFRTLTQHFLFQPSKVNKSNRHLRILLIVRVYLVSAQFSPIFITGERRCANVSSVKIPSNADVSTDITTRLDVISQTNVIFLLTYVFHEHARDKRTVDEYAFTPYIHMCVYTIYPLHNSEREKIALYAIDIANNKISSRLSLRYQKDMYVMYMYIHTFFFSFFCNALKRANRSRGKACGKGAD